MENRRLVVIAPALVIVACMVAGLIGQRTTGMLPAHAAECPQPASLRSDTAGPNTVFYPAGWNLVAGTAMPVPGVNGSLYRFDRTSGLYTVLSTGSELAPGQAAWAYFPCPSGRELCVCPQLVHSVALPSAQYVMIGNPGFAPVTLGGVDDAVIYIYDPVTGDYQQTDTLGPGQGAWAFSLTGGTLNYR